MRIGPVLIGGDNPVAVQTMTDTDTNDTRACVEQIGRIREAGCRMVRLTAQGAREAENLRNIAAEVREQWPDVALVADVHFLPEAALIAAEYVDKVRINPGNYNDKGGGFEALLDKCAERGVALRIGVNHGSLSPHIIEKYGDTPQGMVASAMEFMEKCRAKGFGQAVVSMKSSNVRVMVYAYRLLAAEMAAAGFDFPLHLGVTEAGNGMEGRIKSAAGIGALLADGIGDTVRVSLTEPPENEIPTARLLVDYTSERCGKYDGALQTGDTLFAGIPSPYEYARRRSFRVWRMGDRNEPLLRSEFNTDDIRAISRDEVAVLTAGGGDPVREWRRAISVLDSAGDRSPVVLRRKYADTDTAALAVKAAADFGVMFIDGLADGIWIEAPENIPQDTVDGISLDILQAARARMSKTEYIACPGCGRTLYDLQGTLEDIKSRTSHLKGLKIGVMGCIVNGPGEMADADYGYVGASPGHITLYRGRTPVKKDIPQEEALEELVSLIRSDGKWVGP